MFVYLFIYQNLGTFPSPASLEKVKRHWPFFFPVEVTVWQSRTQDGQPTTELRMFSSLFALRLLLPSLILVRTFALLWPMYCHSLYKLVGERCGYTNAQHSHSGSYSWGSLFTDGLALGNKWVIVSWHTLLRSWPSKSKSHWTITGFSEYSWVPSFGRHLTDDIILCDKRKNRKNVGKTEQ